MVIAIGSEDKVPIDASFRISAGPGAGKTHWLIEHIKDVITHSNKLGVVKKVACITYTNVGTDTIRKRLNFDDGCVEVSTIHSFLFANVVNPYAYLVADEIGLDTENMVIVDEQNYMSQDYAYSLLKKKGKTWIDAEVYNKALCECLWHYDKHQFTDFKPKRAKQVRRGGKSYFIPNSAYMYYKECLWSKGELSYDDILYVSWLILSKYPQIYKLLLSRYPYIFVDEFQDTIPYVVDFLQRMGNEGAIVGVVGDKAQAIYEFAGATVTQFDDFSVPRLQDYAIHGNRRSTVQIVNLLNAVRTEFKQDPLSGLEGDMPVLLVGDTLDCYQMSLEICGTDDVRSLAYQNIVANSMQTRNGDMPLTNILDADFDSDAERQKKIKVLIKAVELSRMGDLRNAWHQLDILDKDRTVSIVYLRKMLIGYEQFVEGSLMDFYSFVNGSLGLGLKPLRKGKSKTYYQDHSYREAALSVKGADADNYHKTIHKSKGDEFDNVFVVLKEEQDLDFMTEPKLNEDVSHRVYYVGISRAINRLFIGTPSLSANREERIKEIKLPIKVVRL